jgi:hypothetical protein
MSDVSVSSARVRERHGSFRRGSPLRIFRVAVALPALFVVATGLLALHRVDEPRMLLDVGFWILIIAIVELLPVPAWKSVHLSIGGPLFMATAFIYSAPVAGIIAFLGSSDPREIKREVTPLHAVFNRSQICLSTFMASLTFHAIADPSSSWLRVVPGALVAVLADYFVNASLVSVDASLMHEVPVAAVLKKLRIGNPIEFLASYVGLGLLGLMLARL